MDQKYRMYVRNTIRTIMSGLTERDLQVVRKSFDGYNSLLRELDGLLDCVLNGPNDHMMPQLNFVLDAIQFIKSLERSKENLSKLSPDLKKILREESTTEYNRKFGSK